MKATITPDDVEDEVTAVEGLGQDLVLAEEARRRVGCPASASEPMTMVE